jgi:DNA/RNA-binding domain of Phe-tRNA-synthetase-like protein
VYRAFGAKPQRTPCSAEALRKRAAKGDVPSVNRIVDAYNAVSIRFAVPIGGEDRAALTGTERLVRAVGDEPFDTVKDGAPAVESPEPGEVIWRDDVAVTCRRWNWRQGRRTALTEATTSAVFLLEGLDIDLRPAADLLAELLSGTLAAGSVSIERLA